MHNTANTCFAPASFHDTGNVVRSEVHGITGIILVSLGITHTQLAFLH